MLSKKERMSREEFSRVFSCGKRLHSPLFQVILEPRKEVVAKRAVVVSKKVAPKAVSRNRLRRMLYEALHDVAPKGSDVIVIAKKPTAALPYTALLDALGEIIGRGPVSR